MRISFWLCSLSILGFAPQYVSQIQLRDFENKLPVSGVQVTVHQHGTVAISDENGNCVFPKSEWGKQHVHFEKAGYVALAMDVFFPLSDTMRVVFMQRTSIEMKQLVIEDAWSHRTDDRSSLETIQPLSSDLRLHAAQSFAATLQYIPGVMAIQTGSGIAKPVIRGMSGSRIALIDNGIKQEGQQWGSDHGWELDQYELENFELIKGPASLQYGSDAAGGAVVIKPHIWPTAKAEWECRSFYASNNQREGTSLSFKSKRKIRNSLWAIGIRGTIARSEDYHLPTKQYTYLNRTLPLADGMLNNTATDEKHGTVWLAGRGVQGSSWKLIYRRFNLSSGLFPGIIGVPTLGAVTSDGDASNIGLPRATVVHDKWIGQWMKEVENGFWQMECGFQKNHREEWARPHQGIFSPPNSDSLSLQLHLETMQLNAKRQWKGEHWVLMTGSQWQRQTNRRGGVEFLIPDFTQLQGGAFVWAEWEPTIKHGVWSGGIRYDQAWFDTQGFSQYTWEGTIQSQGLISRREAFSRRFKAISGSVGWSSHQRFHRVLKWNVARSFRMPQPSELSINGVHHGSFRHEQGNPSLLPEQGWQADVSWGGHEGNQSWHVSPFFHYYETYIYLSPQAQFSFLPDGGQLYRYLQAPVLITGGECFFEKHWWKPLHTDAGIEGVFTYNQNTQLGLPFIPPVQIKSNVVFEKEWNEKGNFKFFAHARKALAQNRTARNEKTTPGYFVMDTGASIQYQLSEIEMEWVLSVNNLFNQKYFNNLSNYRWIQLPEQGRWIQIQCCIKIQ